MLAFVLALGLISLILGTSYFFPAVPGFGILIPLMLSSIGVVLSGKFVIPMLRKVKAGQIVREDGPQAHLAKTGTPTMGGIFILPVGLSIALIWSGFNPAVIAACLLTFGFGFVGWLDDWLILRYKSNKGVSPMAKLGLQTPMAIAFCLWLNHYLSINGQSIGLVNLPFGWALPLGLLFWPLALFVIFGSSHSTNLTDGLDGLAGGTGAIALLGMALLVGATHPELAGFCACLSGSYLGFLWHNRNPARVFMGDTGSLALGAALAATALITNTLWGLVIVGALFVWECLSVIVQVSYFKSTKRSTGVGKRLFKMAPYHHHLELSGWHETQIVATFYIVGMALVILAIALNYFS
ncbi:Phospho-N-acetylmuramoyl-pentapeptide-transferase [Thalassoporum mexicanum PCC 7367]|nr:Phospho-N-acetylmuramoyl-pentapeptide-transferase [Pseudanabaena sp. PCC 7367]